MGATRIGEVESVGKLILIGLALVTLFLVIGSGNFGAADGFAPTDRANSDYKGFARDLFENHGFELTISALIIAGAALGGLQIAREEDSD